MAPRSRARRARLHPRAQRPARIREAQPERLREHLLLRGDQVDAAVLARLLLRHRRSERADHSRQAAAWPVAAGAERQAVRLHAAQPPDPGGDLRGARGRAPLLDRGSPLRSGCGPDRVARAGRLSVVRRRFARQRDRSPPDPPDAGSLRGRARGDRLGSHAVARRQRCVARTGLQHQDAGRAPMRAGHRTGVPRLRAHVAAAAAREPGGGERRLRRGRLLVDNRHRAGAGVAPPVRREQLGQL